jgi:peptidoglycan/LPS O-acetylase OafA/YrhL
MVHIFVQSRLDDALRLTGSFTGLRLLSPDVSASGERIDLIGATPMQGVLLTLVMLALVIGTSWLTWRWIEVPGQRWAKRAATGDDAIAGGALKAESRP